MKPEIDSLIESLLEVTMALQEQVNQHDSDGDDWLEILDKREVLIDQLKEYKTILEDSHKEKLQQVFHINQNVLPIMNGRMQEIKSKINNIQLNKLKMNSYNDEGVNAYGAFFDRKK